MSETVITDTQRWGFLNRHWFSLIEGKQLYWWLSAQDLGKRFPRGRLEAIDFAIRLHENNERNIAGYTWPLTNEVSAKEDSIRRLLNATYVWPTIGGKRVPQGDCGFCRQINRQHPEGAACDLSCIGV